MSVEVKGNMDFDKVSEWLNNIQSKIHENLYRMKGILSVEGYQEKFVFQGVHMQFEGAPLDPWKEGEERKSKLVFIGKDLPKDEIRTFCATFLHHC